MAAENSAPIEGSEPNESAAEAADDGATYVGLPSADIQPAGYVMPDGTTVLPENDPEALATRPPAPEVEEPEPTPAPRAARDPDLEARLARAERLAQEANERFARLAAGAKAEDEVPASPPIALADCRTPADFAQYIEWRDKRTAYDTRRAAQAEARVTAADQHARGLFNESVMGKGFDYDSIIAQYIVPLERQNPATRELFQAQANPALARYLIGTILAHQEKFGDDPVKTFQELNRALSGKSKETTNVINKIAKAAQNGAARTGMRQSRAAAPQGLPVYTAEQIERMHPAQYKNVMAAVRKGEAVLRDQ